MTTVRFARFLLGSSLSLSIALVTIGARAEVLPPTVTLSGRLVEDIANVLASQPYQTVAQILLRLQNEVQHQPPPAPTSQPPAPEKKGK